MVKNVICETCGEICFYEASGWWACPKCDSPKTKTASIDKDLKLHSYPTAIENAQLALLQTTEAIEATKQKLARMDAAKMDSILDARTSENKPTFTNEAQRIAALKKLQNADPAYNEWAGTLQAMESAKAKQSYALTRLQNEFAVAKLDKQEEIQRYKNA